MAQTQQAVQRVHRILAKTRSQRRGRTRSKIADGAQPRPPQRHPAVLLQFQCLDRQAAQGSLLIGRWPCGKAAQRMRALRRACYRITHLHAVPLKPLHRLARQRLLPAPQMRAAGDVQHQPMRRIDRGCRRIARAAIA